MSKKRRAVSRSPLSVRSTTHSFSCPRKSYTRETPIKSWSDLTLVFSYKERNSELFKENHDESVYKNSYEICLCDLFSVSLKSASQFLHYTFPIEPLEPLVPIEPAEPDLIFSPLHRRIPKEPFQCFFRFFSEVDVEFRHHADLLP